METEAKNRIWVWTETDPSATKSLSWLGRILRMSIGRAGMCIAWEVKEKRDSPVQMKIFHEAFFFYHEADSASTDDRVKRWPRSDNRC